MPLFLASNKGYVLCKGKRIRRVTPIKVQNSIRLTTMVFTKGAEGGITTAAVHARVPDADAL